ncbi:translesion error-prone DNA polymerase V autoproteolytic subunit [Cryobacterium frigoriphilum]|uniref:Translesion error-prone DNA polymerase V autoproteolytic subunit n=1 Tax=Cryobacterium frigoriphilum TaxID=1259150 RepID=A0A4R9A818_9MICO|nr:translesion error-prone DNA polymerase V autoproteolytic subunit [Cryobacterium frigoriphilum]TFD53985.1 translesion error-prone DNA polymerase V autoproteolytic subunit [Cryobacterium frigoriphilum]
MYVPHRWTVADPVAVAEADELTGPTRGYAQAAPEAVHAGFPSPAGGYYTGPVDLNRHLIQDPTATFIVRVSGDSMTGAGIFDGDEVIVDRSLDARDGSVVIAVVDSELTIKRLRINHNASVPGSIRLVPENPAYPDIVLGEMSELTIWGVVTRCLHRV